jgi:glyoxylase-like metal-dependent hydrolase (beta-lactamase superfamily II)
MPEGSYRFPVGSLWCTALSDGYHAYPTEWFFPNAEPAALAEALEKRRMPQESILSPYTCLLIETGQRVALVDTGAGAVSQTTGAIAARLEMAGIRPKDVDTVVLTHAHPDHLGGALNARGRPQFPNAVHYIAEREYEFWSAPRRNLTGMRLPDDTRRFMEETARRCLEPLRHQIEPVEGENEILPGVRILPAPGHTPGHLALLLDSGGQQLLNLGDAAVHPLHLEHPEWENGFDLSPEVAAATRRSLLERAAAARMHVMAFHFPYPSVGRVEARNGAWEWIPGW